MIEFFRVRVRSPGSDTSNSIKESTKFRYFSTDVHDMIVPLKFVVNNDSYVFVSVGLHNFKTVYFNEKIVIGF